MHKVIGLVRSLRKILMPYSFKPIFVVKLKPIHPLPNLRCRKSIYLGIGKAL